MKVLISIAILLVCAILILGSPIINNKTTNLIHTGKRQHISVAQNCQGKWQLLQRTLHEDKGSQHFKTKRGIYNECCLVTCKRKYLKDNYCAPEPQMSTTTTPKPKPPTFYHVTYFVYHMDLVREVMKYFQMFE